MNTPSESQDERARAALAAAHDDVKFPDDAASAILARAHEVAAQRRGAGSATGGAPAPRTWRMPLTLAAGFALGLVVSWVFVVARGPDGMAGTSAEVVGLTLPAARVTRDQSPSQAPIPVEKADPQDWYRYIQELIFAGQLDEAEKHLKRFNELHPGFVPKPD